MSKLKFSKKDIEILSQNPYVKKVSDKAITYTNDFKVLFMNQYNEGKNAVEIFTDAGFDVRTLGMIRIDCACNRWKKAFWLHGAAGLTDTRKKNSGRPKKHTISKSKLIEMQKNQIEMLTKENEQLRRKIDELTKNNG